MKKIWGYSSSQILPLPKIFFSLFIALLLHPYSLLNPPPEIGPGRHLSWHRGSVFHAAPRPPDAGDGPGRTNNAAACWHGTPGPRVPNAAWHQDTAGDGNCRIQEAAGWRGQVREEYCLFFHHEVISSSGNWTTTVFLMEALHFSRLLQCRYQYQ